MNVQNVLTIIAITAVIPLITASSLVTPALANDLTPEDILSLQDPAQLKVTICHIPPGDPANRHTITVGAQAVPAHIRNHGDYIGPCQPPQEIIPSSP
jgi:hypothetical protein